MVRKAWSPLGPAPAKMQTARGKPLRQHDQQIW
jgi:hypothetical protein